MLSTCPVVGRKGSDTPPPPGSQPHSRQSKVGQQSPSSWVRISSSPGPHLGGLWGQVVMLQTVGESRGCQVPPPSALPPRTRANQRSAASFSHHTGPAPGNPQTPSSFPRHPPAGGAEGSPHSVSRQQELLARGLVTVTKPARLHCGGRSWASHGTGVHCTDLEPSWHTQSWQLLTHRSPGWNRAVRVPGDSWTGPWPLGWNPAAEKAPALSVAWSALGLPLKLPSLEQPT